MRPERPAPWIEDGSKITLRRIDVVLHPEKRAVFCQALIMLSIYYPDLAAFKSAIVKCLAQTQNRHKVDLDTLLVLSFQTVKKRKLWPRRVYMLLSRCDSS